MRTIIYRCEKTILFKLILKTSFEAVLWDSNLYYYLKIYRIGKEKKNIKKSINKKPIKNVKKKFGHANNIWGIEIKISSKHDKTNPSVA